MPSPGPLAGVRVVELAGIGPGPFAAMLLADLGAEVVRVDRADAVHPHAPGPHPDVALRGRRSIGVDLKHPDGRAIVLDLVRDADLLIEGFRPGVTERLGLGPTDCAAVNPRLVYGRMTGWGQDGPLAQTAGHDLTYLAVTGALWGSRRAGGKPTPPINLLGDLGGGSTYLVVGLLAALLEAARTGHGQVVDAAIVDGVASMTTFIQGLRQQGVWDGPPGGNMLDSGAPWYDTYACADGEYIAVGALEPQFYAALLDGLRRAGIAEVELTELDPAVRMEPDSWAAAKARFTAIFARRTRDDWAGHFAGTDACVAPVLSWDEARRAPHLAERGTFVEHDGVVQPAPAPRFDRTPGALTLPPPHPGEHTDAIVAALGRSPDELARLRGVGAVA